MSLNVEKSSVSQTRSLYVALLRGHAHIHFSKLLFAWTNPQSWYWRRTGHAYVLGLESCSERLYSRIPLLESSRSFVWKMKIFLESNFFAFFGFESTQLAHQFTLWGRLWGLSTTPRDRVQNSETTRYKSWDNFLGQDQYWFCERVPISERQCRPKNGNDASPPSSPTAESGSQRCVACHGIGRVASDFSGRTCLSCKK